MSVSDKEILYAAYGDMERILPALLNRGLGSGISVVMHDVQLCIQGMGDVPDIIAEGAPAPVSPREVLHETWGDDFSAYVLKPKPGECTPARLFTVTEGEYGIIADYNLYPFGWFSSASMRVTAIDPNREHSISTVITDIVGVDQPADPIEIERRGYVVQPPLNGERSLEVAENVRRAYFERLAE